MRLTSLGPSGSLFVFMLEVREDFKVILWKMSPLHPSFLSPLSEASRRQDIPQGRTNQKILSLIFSLGAVTIPSVSLSIITW